MFLEGCLYNPDFKHHVTVSVAHCPVASNLKSTVCDELTATFDPTMRFERSNSNLENFHDVFGIAAFSLLLTPWRDIS